MLSQHIIDQLQPYDFDRLAHKEKDGRRRLRLIALAHLKDGKSYTEVAAALRVTRHAVMRWVQWFSAGGVARLAGMPHDWSTQRLAKAQEGPFVRRPGNCSANAVAAGCGVKTYASCWPGSLAWPTA